jgi:ERCC4-type nuclease
VLIDTREKEPLPLFLNHPNWIGGERRVALKAGDYTVEGMESLLSLERKSLADLIACSGGVCSTIWKSRTVQKN